MNPRLPMVLAMAAVAGCSADAYRQRADDDAYAIVAEKQKEALGKSKPFSIDPPLLELRKHLEESPLPPEPASESVAETRVLTLEDCLDAAAEDNRDLQRQKEIVFITALSLSLARYQFENQYFGLVDATGTRDRDDTKSAEVNSAFGFSRVFSTGLRAIVSVGNDFFRLITHPSQRTDTSFLTVALSQPLLRGAGAAVVREPLVQAERDAVYAVRDYERFRQELCVRVVSGMYRVLQQRDQVANERANLASLTVARERTESLSEAGRLPRFQVDQAQQNELRAQNGLVDAKAQYESVLDEFKILLGLPTDAPIEIDPAEFGKLRERGLGVPPLPEEAVVDIALQTRLDFRNDVDRVEDASRKIVVAENALQAGLDISFTADVRTDVNQPTDFMPNQTRYTAGLSLDLPFDRVAERNAYRTSLIVLEQRERDATLSEDRIKQDVRTALRRLDQALQSFNIQSISVKLAETRIESTSLLLQAGRAETRDLLEAQAALLDAQNSLTRALVDHRIAILELLRDTGVLHLEPVGLRYDESIESFGPAEP